ncbi:hypothetical protein EON64_01350 [archaeon]|nr:MAG: hypothetical protein EON64_01350 [archaeon]
MKQPLPTVNFPNRQGQAHGLRPGNLGQSRQMNDPELRFFSSLRSSPEKVPGKRSSLSVSAWYSPEEAGGSRRHSAPISGGRRSSVNNANSPMKHASYDHSSQLDNRPIMESKQDSRLLCQAGGIWEPPVSCRRRQVQAASSTTSYSQYFPIELNNRDYFNRVLALFIQAIDMLDMSLLTKGRAQAMLTFSADEFINMLSSQCPQNALSSLSDKVTMLLQQSVPLVSQFESSIKLSLEYKGRLFQPSISYGSCMLTDMTNLFEACSQLVRNLYSYVHVADGLRRVESELRTLHNQLRLHASFQQTRMSALGWKWDALDTVENPALEDKWNDCLQRHETIESDASAYQVPSTRALVQLAHRLVLLEQELQRLSEKAGDHGDYSEAQRLRGLAQCMECSVGSSERMLLDRLRMLLSDMGGLIADLDRLSAIKRQDRDFPAAQSAEEASIRLFRLREDLQSLLQPMPLVDLEGAGGLMRTQGSVFIDSNYIFLTEHWADGQSVAALLIRAASQDMLRAIEQWPLLTALKSSAHCRAQQTQQLALYHPSAYEMTVDLGASNDIFQQIDYNYSGHPSSFLGHHSSTRAVVPDGGEGRGEGDGDYGDSYQLQSHSQSSSFSSQVLSSLKAFDMLQQELDSLLTPTASAHSQLICRLIGVSNDLTSLLDIANADRLTGTTNQSREGERLRALIVAIEGSIDADEETAEIEEDKAAQHMLYGRKRIDYIWQIISKIKPSIRELMKLKSMARSYHDFTAAATLEAMLLNLEKRIRSVEDSIVSFSILDTDNDAHIYDTSLDVNERIAREGTAFLTADYLFSYSSGSRGHNIGSLAIIAGAGSVLRHIKHNWPGLSALGNNSTDAATSPVMHSARHRSHSLSGGGFANFRDANSLRLLGFDPQTLRVAGFSTVDILTAGYTAEQLKMAGFDAQSLQEAAGLSSVVLHHTTGTGGLDNKASSGHALEVTAQLLFEFYSHTSGAHWRKADTWKDLEQLLKIAQNSFTRSNGEKLSILSYHQQLRGVFSKLFGVEADKSSYDIVKLVLMQNSLQGGLPVSLGSMTTLQYLVLSNNKLTGSIPGSLGLLVQLKSLVLDHNMLEGEIPRTIKQLQNLTVLKLEHNRLEGILACM